MTKPWRNLSIFVGLVFMLAVPGCTDFQAAEDAYNRGDYETALKKFLPLADQGLAAAQHYLGVMYGEGKGVPQDYAEAMKWYRLAANQGDADAQYNLGGMYFSGHGVARNHIQAYMWLTLAAAQGNELAAQGLEIMEKKMTPAQLAEAQRLAREWALKGE